jgi:osmotically-inducible protein OsmY
VEGDLITPEEQQMDSIGKRTDVDVREDVRDELTWEPRINATLVHVGVTGGRVTLTGTVDSWAARAAACKATHRVAGVLDVVDELRVQPESSTSPSDEEIAVAVRRALEWDVFVRHERIQSTVSAGVVTLEGRVDLWTQYDDAARAIRNLAGVREIRNHILVEPPVPASPDAVRGAIEAALDRHATHAAKQVRITVSGGKVTLDGQVPSWAERRAVEGAVRSTAGVKVVDSHLRIQA